VTDEVLPQCDFAENFLENTLPAAHLIRPCGAPSPQGEGFWGASQILGFPKEIIMDCHSAMAFCLQNARAAERRPYDVIR